MGTIFIEGLEFHAFHGFFKEEQKIGGKYLVDIKIDTDFSIAADEDDLKGTINYAEVASIVEKEMQVKSKLIEHVARRIIERLLLDIPAIQLAEVKVSKINPPLGLKLKSVSVVLEKKRN